MVATNDRTVTVFGGTTPRCSNCSRGTEYDAAQTPWGNEVIPPDKRPPRRAALVAALHPLAVEIIPGARKPPVRDWQSLATAFFSP